MKLTRNKSGRERRKNDYYPTPYGLAHAALNELICPTLALDAGCGKGVWIEALQNIGKSIGKTVKAIGVDLEPQHPAGIQDDFLKYNPPTRFDMVMGNPPYNQMEPFVRHALEDDMLVPGGSVFFLCRLEFLASRTRCYGLFQDHPLHRVYVLARRPRSSPLMGTGQQMHRTMPCSYGRRLPHPL